MATGAGYTWVNRPSAVSRDVAGLPGCRLLKWGYGQFTNDGRGAGPVKVDGGFCGKGDEQNGLVVKTAA